MKTNENTPIRCNRCSAKFWAEKKMERDCFCGQKAARVQDFSTCPECGQTDCHWVYASDVMPVFPGGREKRRMAEMKWLRAN